MSANEPLDLDLDLDLIGERNVTAIGHAERGDTVAYSKVYRSALDVPALVAAVRERDAEIARLKRIVAFFACTIKSGESWSEQCEAALGEALRQAGTEPPQPAEEA